MQARVDWVLKIFGTQVTKNPGRFGPCFHLSVSYDYVEKNNPSEKVAIVDIGYLKDSPRLVFIDEEMWNNLIVVHDSEELTRNINQKKKSKEECYLEVGGWFY